MLNPKTVFMGGGRLSGRAHKLASQALAFLDAIRPEIRMVTVLMGLVGLYLVMPVSVYADVPFQQFGLDIQSAVKTWALSLGGLCLLVTGYLVYMGHEGSGEHIRKMVIALACLGAAYAGGASLLTSFQLK